MSTPRRGTSGHRLTYPDCNTPTGSYRRPFFRPRNADLPCIVSFPCVFVMAATGCPPYAAGNQIVWVGEIGRRDGMAQVYEFIVSAGEVFDGLSAGNGQPNQTIYVLPG